MPCDHDDSAPYNYHINSRPADAKSVGGQDNKFIYIMFGILMVTCVIGLCAVLAAGSRVPYRWSPWGACGVTCGQTPGLQSRRAEWRWRCRTGVNGWCRAAYTKQTRRCESNIPCVTPKPAVCRCTPPRYTEPCCPRGETSINIA